MIVAIGVRVVRVVNTEVCGHVRENLQGGNVSDGCAVATRPADSFLAVSLMPAVYNIVCSWFLGMVKLSHPVRLDVRCAIRSVREVLIYIGVFVVESKAVPNSGAPSIFAHAPTKGDRNSIANNVGICNKKPTLDPNYALPRLPGCPYQACHRMG